MDLESEISKMFENNEYNDLFKIRWLYFFVCNLFSYDLRFIFAKDNLKEQIYNKEIKIDSVADEDFEIVCYTISRTLVDILSKYGYECKIIRESQNKFSHVYVEVKCKNYVLKLDPTKRHDLTRAKINSNTLDFTQISDNSNFFDELKEIDSIITNDYRGIDKSIFYDNETIEKLVQVVEDNAKKHNRSECEIFYEKIEYLFCLINTRSDLKRFDDIDYYFSYLIKKFKLNEKTEIINGNEVSTKVIRIKPAIFFNVDDEKMRDMINISIIQYENIPPIMYLLKKEGETFIAKEIFKNEAIELLKQYRNPLCQFVFEKETLNLSNEDTRKPLV